MKFPWQKPSMQEQMLNQMKANISSQIAQQMPNQFMNGICTTIAKNAGTTLVTVLGWKKVPLVKVDPQEDKDDQDAIYNAFMARTNGDRDMVHDVPDQIEMKAFVGDKMDPNDREHLYEVIDIINEANQINATGVYRTKETMSAENKRTEEQAGVQVSYDGFRVENVLGRFMATLQPVLDQMINMAASFVGIMAAVKMMNLFEKALA